MMIDISNGSRVIVLTDRHRQTKSQTDTTENNTTLTVLLVLVNNVV